MSYNFTIILHPWGESPEHGTVSIDPVARYGFWEHRDGTEGGGLWFEALELVDYDGAYALPRSVIAALRGAGYVLDESYDN